jgi:hypothetical protein
VAAMEKKAKLKTFGYAMTPMGPLKLDMALSRILGLRGDLVPAVSLQQLITAFACQSVIDQKITHRHIPDTPVVESERRQILFGAAIGIPTFFVQKQTPNVLMQSILKEVVHTRQSSQYPGHIRIHNFMVAENFNCDIDMLR